MDRVASRVLEAGGGLLQRVTGDRGASGAGPGDAEAERTATIARPAEELGRLWREPGTLTAITSHLGERGATLERDVRIVDEQPGSLLRWEPRPGAELPTEGTLRFRPAPNGEGTEVVLRLRLAGAPIPGLAARAVTARTLRQFKALAEAGEIPTLERNPSARPAEGDAV
jgi:uncharacterized membrane protein